MSKIIKTENLVYSYQASEGEQPVRVLNGIDIEIESGTFVAVLGHNGSGKSTFAKHINAILVPDEGKVLIEGMDTAVVLAALERAGATFEDGETPVPGNLALTKADFVAAGLSGCADSDAKRQRLMEALGLPRHLSANRLLEVVNATLTAAEWQQLLNTIHMHLLWGQTISITKSVQTSMTL